MKVPSDYRHRNQYTGPALLSERFWSKVDVQGLTDCWLWLGSKSGRDDRGYIGVDGRNKLAHRVAWEVTYGSIPDELNVLHSCDNPPCCNPNHLFLGTQKDNMIDAVAKGRIDRSGEKNPRAGLTEVDVRRIRSVFRAGFSRQEIANARGLKYGHVCDIISERIWKGV